MHAGHVISGAGHLTLIGWLLLGGLLTPDPEPFEVQEVAVISSADFDAMIAALEPPQSAVEVAQPATPETPTEEPAPTSTPDEAPSQPAPQAQETPVEDTPPEVPEPPAPADVSDTAPDLTEPPGDTAVLVPEVAPEAAPRPVERVAPEPVAQPEPEATPDPVEQEAVAPDEAGEAPEQEAQEATAPEEAVTEVVTEATAAPAASARPPGQRPAAPAPRQTAEVETPVPAETPSQSTSSSDTDDAVRAALQAAEAATAAPAPTGPPLSAGERNDLKAAIARCWNVGALSTEAKSTIIVVALDMNQNGTPVTDSIRFVSATGGSNAAAQRVFDTARRAIIRCGSSGFQLPPEKFSQWQKIEITFDPSKMGF